MTLDLNVLALGHAFLSLGAYAVSDDGDRLAYSVDVTGFREYTLYVKDLLTGEMLPDRAEKVSTVAWAAAGATFFYVTEDHAKRAHRAVGDLDADPVVKGVFLQKCFRPCRGRPNQIY